MFGRAASILLYTLVLAMLTGVPVAVGALLFDWSWTLVFTVTLVMGNVAAFVCLRLFADHRYQIARKSLNVSSSGRVDRVLFTSVVCVERVRHRVRGRVQEWVRVVYRQGNQQKRVEVQPECADLFVADLVSQCPQLTGFNQRKLPNVRLEDDGNGTGLPSAVLLA